MTTGTMESRSMSAPRAVPEPLRSHRPLRGACRTRRSGPRRNSSHGSVRAIGGQVRVPGPERARRTGFGIPVHPVLRVPPEQGALAGRPENELLTGASSPVLRLARYPSAVPRDRGQRRFAPGGRNRPRGSRSAFAMRRPGKALRARRRLVGISAFELACRTSRNRTSPKRSAGYGRKRKSRSAALPVEARACLRGCSLSRNDFGQTEIV